VAGPALFELPGATCWVPAGWRGRTDPYGTLVLEPQSRRLDGETG
jgi:hypothetical protein